MRWLVLVVGIAVGCGSSDDASSGSGGGTQGSDDGSGPSSVGSNASATASGSGSSVTASTGSGGASGGACDGEFLCVGYDVEADCVDDPCCQVSYGRVYEEDKTGWCLGEMAEYVGCSWVGGNDDCDFEGTIVCGSADDPEPPTYVELDGECFPNGCAVSQAPADGVPNCPPA